MYLISKTQIYKFVKQNLFKVGGKSVYTNIWYDTNLSKRRFFNY